MRQLPITFALIFIGSILTISQLSCMQPEDKENALRELLDSRRLLLPNGWSLSVPGESIPLGDFPLNLVASKDGRLMAVTNNGQSEQSLMLIDPGKVKVIQTTVIPKSWYGLAFNNDHSRLFASGGNDNMIRIYSTAGNELVETDAVPLGKAWPIRISPAGMTLDNVNENLFVVTKEDSALYRCNLLSKEIRRLFLGHEAYTCLLSKDGSVLYLSLIHI